MRSRNNPWLTMQIDQSDDSEEDVIEEDDDDVSAI